MEKNGKYNFGPMDEVPFKAPAGETEMDIIAITTNGTHKTNGHVEVKVNGDAERQSLMPDGDPSRSGSRPGSGRQENEGGRMPFVMMLLRKRLHYLPIVTAIFIVCSFIISYIIAVTHGHVEPDFPYISYTAIKAPERCWFAQLVNVGAFMLAANIYIRYKQMGQVLSGTVLNAAPRDKRINTASVIIGFISAFGLSMVANFQTVEMRPLHYTGAGLAFILGLCYCWMQTSLSIRYCRWSCVAVSQLVNSIVLTACLVVFAISKAVYKINEAKGNGTKYDTLRGVYLVSTVSEWLTATSIVTFVLTFYRDFSRVIFKSPTVEIMNRDTVLQDYHIGLLATGGSARPRQNGNVPHAV